MIVKWLAQKLFKGRGKRQASPLTVHHMKITGERAAAVKELLSSVDFTDPKIKDAMEQISQSIPSIRNNKPITSEQIQIDSASLLVMFMTGGYEPLQVMLLMTKVYGSIMASAPDVIGQKDDGTTITPEMIEHDFFEACKQQRIHYKEINNKIFSGVEDLIGKGTIH